MKSGRNILLKRHHVNSRIVFKAVGFQR